jgi:putative SOS response-associated peptidase YedK
MVARPNQGRERSITLVTHIHDRNPVLLTPETLDAWIDPHNLGEQSLLDAIAAESDLVAGEVEFHQVGSAVGSVKNNSSELILPL